MATGSKRGRKTAPRSRKKLKKNQNPGIAEEILLFGALGVAILLFLGCCGLLGRFGEIVHDALVGVFGMVGFLFPFIFFLVCAFIISNKWEKVTKVKLSSSAVFIVVLCCAAQLIFGRKLINPDNSDFKLAALYTNGGLNGGFVGGVTAHFLWKYIGIAGTIVILVVLFIICVVLLTDRSFFTSIKEGSKIITEDARRNAEYRRKVNEVRSMEREERDLERWEKRRASHERHVAKQEAKRAAQLEERKKRAEERKAENAGKIHFDASDLKKNAPSDMEALSYEEAEPEVDEVIEEADETYTYPGESVVSEEEIKTVTDPGPESMFYGSSDAYVSTIVKETDNSQNEEEPSGLMSGTKLEKRDFSGEVTEITGFYEGASEEELFGTPEPTETPKPNVRTHHRISISSGMEGSEDDHHDTDEFSGDQETAEDDYGDVAELFDRRNTNEVVPNVKPRTSHGINLAEENRKPAPESGAITRGKSIRASKSGKIKIPPAALLNEAKITEKTDPAAELNETARELKDTLKNFGLDIQILGSSRGPAVTRYEIQMPTGVSVKKITGLADDIMMSLGAKDIRIEAPIPGKKAVGIELPNRESTMVHFRELIESRKFRNFDSKVAFAVGKDLAGDIVVTDIAKMPHLLIAGATGSGKSVCINTLIMSILYKSTPDDVRLIMVDPKMVELSVYNGIPHLLIPVVTDPKKASAALNWAVAEMTRRYQCFAELEVRDMKGYNSKIAANPSLADASQHARMPQIVIIVDELADLMMVAAKEVEESICRLAQLARAAGIYLILATQRPSVDVITGLIKANMPSRIAFSVSSNVDSRTILDMAGAERLLGNGDMFFYPRGYNKPARVQGAFVSDDEVMRVVQFLKDQAGSDNYDMAAQSAVESGNAGGSSTSPGLVDPSGAFDELFVVAGQAVIESQKASIGMLQRKFKVGFNRAARIMDQLCEEGVVGAEEGTKPRRILMTMDEFNDLLEEKNHQ